MVGGIARQGTSVASAGTSELPFLSTQHLGVQELIAGIEDLICINAHWPVHAMN